MDDRVVFKSHMSLNLVRGEETVERLDHFGMTRLANVRCI